MRGTQQKKTYYTEQHAAHYNRSWHTFLQKTLAATFATIDVASLQQKASAQEHPLRFLDAACGTGLLLQHLSHLFPHAELYGVDASSAMLAQAACLLQEHLAVHLDQATLRGGTTAALPYAPTFFDLITCSNSVHYLADPEDTLRGFKHLLAPGGQMVIEDYVLRGLPFPWKAFEWIIKIYDPHHVRLYTRTEAQALCQNAGFLVVDTHSFSIDLFCQGWVLRNVLS
ncbi:MAG: hypothetical protein NVS4B7_03650 [Ktedonobacteraceae bacterium]